MALKKGYKQTDIGVFPKDWEIVSLSNLVHILDGTHQTPKYTNDGIPFYSVENLTANNFTNTKYISHKEHLVISKNKSIKIGDILMTRIGSLGVCKYVNWDMDASFYVSLSLLKAKSDNIDMRYLAYSSKTKYFIREIESNSLIYAIPQKINLGQIGLVRVAAPKERKEQIAIANILDDYDNFIELINKKINKKHLIKQGVMHDLLTSQKRLEGFIKEWDNIIIGDLGYSYTGLSGKDKSDFENGNAEYITFLNVMNNSVIDLTALERVFIAPNDSQNKVNKGDLLFNTSSETPEEVGMCSLFDSDRSNLYLNSFCFGFRITNREKADGLFLSYYFRGEPGRKIMGVLAQGATRYNLSKQNFLKTSVLLPELDEQKAIANILYDIDVEIGLLETKKLKYENLRQAVMEQLLTGQIRLVGKTTKQKTVTAKKEPKKATKHSNEFEEATVITFLVDKFATTQYPLSRFRYTKYSYLLHRKHQRAVDGFGKYAAGPYKPTNRYKGPENIAIKNNYISKVPNPKSGNDAFLSSENKDAGIQYFNKYYGDEIGQWIEQFRYYKGDYLEVLTTIDMAMKDLEETSKQITVASLREYIASIPEWRKKLEYDYFTDENIEKAMAESRTLFG